MAEVVVEIDTSKFKGGASSGGMNTGGGSSNLPKRQSGGNFQRGGGSSSGGTQKKSQKSNAGNTGRVKQQAGKATNRPKQRAAVFQRSTTTATAKKKFNISWGSFTAGAAVATAAFLIFGRDKKKN